MSEGSRRPRGLLPRTLWPGLGGSEARQADSDAHAPQRGLGPGTLERIFLMEAAGAPPRAVDRVEALAGRGLRGDRYAAGRGVWSRIEPCQVTLIEAEALEAMTAALGVAVADGEHRRNLVTRGVDLAAFGGRHFRIGGVRLGFDRHRPSCAYLASLTEKRLPKALMRHGCGIGVRVLGGGPLRVGDTIEDLGPDPDLWSTDLERFRRVFG